MRFYRLVLVDGWDPSRIRWWFLGTCQFARDSQDTELVVHPRAKNICSRIMLPLLYQWHLSCLLSTSPTAAFRNLDEGRDWGMSRGVPALLLMQPLLPPEPLDGSLQSAKIRALFLTLEAGVTRSFAKSMKNTQQYSHYRKRYPAFFGLRTRGRYKIRRPGKLRVYRSHGCLKRWMIPK